MLLEEGITPEKQTKEEGRNRKTRLFGKSMGRGPPKRKRKRLRQTLLSRQQQQLAENESSPSLSLFLSLLARPCIKAPPSVRRSLQVSPSAAAASSSRWALLQGRASGGERKGEGIVGVKERGALIYIGTSIGKRREEGRSDRGDSVWCFFSSLLYTILSLLPPFPPSSFGYYDTTGKEGRKEGRGKGFSSIPFYRHLFLPFADSPQGRKRNLPCFYPQGPMGGSEAAREEKGRFVQIGRDYYAHKPEVGLGQRAVGGHWRGICVRKVKQGNFPPQSFFSSATLPPRSFHSFHSFLVPQTKRGALESTRREKGKRKKKRRERRGELGFRKGGN